MLVCWDFGSGAVHGRYWKSFRNYIESLLDADRIDRKCAQVPSMPAIPVQARRPLALLAPTWQTVEESPQEHAQLVLLEHMLHRVIADDIAYECLSALLLRN